MKQGNLFCFVSHRDFPNHSASCCTLNIFGNFLMGKVHQPGLRLFGITTWKLLIIEPLFPWKVNEFETKNCIGIWGHFGVIGKPSMNQI
jgi:hypothetical protein